MGLDNKGKLSSPNQGLDGADSATNTCKKWNVQLLDINGQPVTKKVYKLLAPIEDNGTLNGKGETSLYDPPLPSDTTAIDIQFGLKLLPKIESLYDGYLPHPDNAADAVGGEYKKTYDQSVIDYTKKNQPNENPYLNTCTVRTSLAFNKSAHDDAPYTIPRDPSGRGHGIPSGKVNGLSNLYRLSGDKDKWPDGKNHVYALRVREFEPYMDLTYPDAPKLEGAKPEDFAGKDGVITSHNFHFDVLKDDKVRYNAPALRGHGPTLSDGSYSVPWKHGEVRLWQHVVIKPKSRTVANGVCTFVLKMESR